ncbi:MAG: DUF368 domain-containing protein [Cyclobacteriaceae bacterium]
MFQRYFFVFLKGLAMGAADVVPGVSGGTVAFITGIYERLLNALKSFNLSLLKLIFKGKIKEAWRHIDGIFLLSLFIGILLSVVSLAKVIGWCLHDYPQLLWSFFFGLIIASIIYIIRQIDHWNVSQGVTLVIGIGIALLITSLSPSEIEANYLTIFIAGAIAICAMILPGISGSFILLLMGMYSNVLTAVNERNLVFVGVFMLGCIVGLLSFSHVLSWTLKKYRNQTLALLTGFMIGALNKVWPWQNTTQFRVNSHGENIPFITENVLPSHYSEHQPLFYGCLLLLLVGFILVLVLEKTGSQIGKK